MKKIPKKLHYVWFGRGEKPEYFKKYLLSWKKFCPDYEILEWNEDNFDISQNKYLNKFYNNKKWAFASDYARVKILYNEGGIYLDTDIEILKNIDSLLDNDFFTGFQDSFLVGGAIFGSVKNHYFLKELLDFYEDRNRKIIIPNLFTKILKRHGLQRYNSKQQNLEKITIYTKDYFYPYAYFEKKENMKITKNTYAIHNYDATWLPKIVVKVIFPIIGFIAKIRNK